MNRGIFYMKKIYLKSIIKDREYEHLKNMNITIDEVEIVKETMTLSLKLNADEIIESTILDRKSVV